MDGRKSGERCGPPPLPLSPYLLSSSRPRPPPRRCCCGSCRWEEERERASERHTERRRSGIWTSQSALHRGARQKLHTSSLPPSFPLGSTFLLHVLERTSVNQALPPPPFHHFGSPSLRGGKNSSGGYRFPIHFSRWIWDSGCDLGRCRAFRAITRRGDGRGEREVRGHLNFK